MPTATITTSSGVDVSLSDHHAGDTNTYLLLHGGGGPATVAAFAGLLADHDASRVLVPTHPGFGGTLRPASLTSTRELAAVYTDVLDELDLKAVTVVGNSFGGWVAAEMALRGSTRLARAVIVDGIGIVVTDHPVTTLAGLAPGDIAQLSFHDPSKAPRPADGTASPSPDIAALIAYAGPSMSDPTLLDRLGAVDLPVRVIWGESDGIVDPAYGRAYAAAMTGSDFILLPHTGHLPQVESPEQLLEALTRA